MQCKLPPPPPTHTHTQTHIHIYRREWCVSVSDRWHLLAFLYTRVFYDVCLCMMPVSVNDVCVINQHWRAHIRLKLMLVSVPPHVTAVAPKGSR